MYESRVLLREASIADAALRPRTDTFPRDCNAFAPPIKIPRTLRHPVPGIQCLHLMWPNTVVHYNFKGHRNQNVSAQPRPALSEQSIKCNNYGSTRTLTSAGRCGRGGGGGGGSDGVMSAKS